MLARSPMLRCLAWLTLLCAAAAFSPARADPIDQIIRAERKRQHSPAIGVAVVRNGRPLKVQSYGLANLEWQSAATPATYFQTASVGKQFTAVLVMLLARDGKLQLDSPVSSYLQGVPATWQGITVRHLLTHTAGLVRTDSSVDLRKDYTEDELLASAFKQPLEGSPGKQHVYSDLGYQVLGILCSKVGGRFWGEQMRQRVFEPLGMKSRVISERDIVPGRAAGYVRLDGVMENQEWVAPSQNTTADGSLYATPQDMARWALALDNQRLLSKEEKETLWKPASLDSGQLLDYGLGWAVFNEAGHRMVRHRGDWQGFSAHILHLPEDRLTISVLMNRAHGHAHVIADRIAAHFIPALRKPTVVPPTNRALLATPMFVRGGMNQWNSTAALVETQPGLLQARLALTSGMQQFKIGDAGWKLADLGAGFDQALVKPGRPQLLENKGEDLFLPVQQAGDYVFQLDLRGRKGPLLTVLPPAPGQRQP